MAGAFRRYSRPRHSPAGTGSHDPPPPTRGEDDHPHIVRKRTSPALIRPGEPTATPPLRRRPDPLWQGQPPRHRLHSPSILPVPPHDDPVRAEIVDTRRPQAAGGFFYFRRPVMTTSHVQSGTQDFETQGVQLPNADVVHATGPATDVDQDRPQALAAAGTEGRPLVRESRPVHQGQPATRPQDHRKPCGAGHWHRRRRDRDAGQGMPTASEAGPAHHQGPSKQGLLVRNRGTAERQPASGALQRIPGSWARPPGGHPFGKTPTPLRRRMNGTSGS